MLGKVSLYPGGVLFSGGKGRKKLEMKTSQKRVD
jgi:hypothetical protein